MTDLEIPGVGFNYKHTRTYRSQETTDRSQGVNWLHNHEERIVMVRGTFIGGDQPLFQVSSESLPPEFIWVRAGDYPGDNDRWSRFSPDQEIEVDGNTIGNFRLEKSAPNVRGVYFPHGDSFTRIEIIDTNTGNNYAPGDYRDDELVLYSRGGWRRTYKSFPLMGNTSGTINAEWSHLEYFLTKTEDANGNTMKYNYQAVQVPEYSDDDDTVDDYEVRLSSVEDTLGRKINYGYDINGRLSYIEDFLGRSVNYSYDQYGNLTRVQSPRVIDATVTNNTFTDTGTVQGTQRKTEVYEYSTLSSTQSANRRLHHNLLAVYRPNENDDRHGLAGDHSYLNPGSGDPALSWTYYCNDRVKSHTVGSGVVSGDDWESGGTFSYTYNVASGAPAQAGLAADAASFRVVETDPKGNITRYWYDDYARGSLVRLEKVVRHEQLTTNPDTWQEELFVTQHRYNGDNKLNILTQHPSGAVTLKDYDSRGISFVSQSNMIRRVEIPAKTVTGIPGEWEVADQAFQDYRYAYDPVYNKPWVEVGPRGTQGVPMPNPVDGLPQEYLDLIGIFQIFINNELPLELRSLIGDQAVSQPLYSPTVNNSSVSPGRYAKEYIFDYQEDIGNKNAARAIIGVSSGAMDAMIARAEEQRADILDIPYIPLARMNIGDVNGNGDGDVDQVAGNIIKTLHPTVHLPDNTLQAVESTTQYDDDGRPVLQIDANGNKTKYEYGTTTTTIPMNPANTFVEINKAYGEGFLEKVTVAPGTGTSDLNLVTTFVRNPLGQVIKATDPRGNVSVTKYNELGQPIRQRSYQGSDTAVPPVLLAESFTLYDANNNVIASYITDIKTNDSGGGASYTYDPVSGNGSLPVSALTIPAPSVPSSPTANSPANLIGSRTEYNISDLPIRQHVEATHPAAGSGSVWLTSETRYDANEMPAWAKTPLGYITTTFYDQRKLAFQMTRGVETPQESITTSYFDAAGNVVESIDAQASPNNGEQRAASYSADAPGLHWVTGAPAVLRVVGLPTGTNMGQDLAFSVHTGNVTRMYYDGYNRLKRTVDPIGNVTLNFYDPASNIVETAYFGPIDGASPINAAGTNNKLLSLTRMRHDELSRNYRTDRLVGLPSGVAPLRSALLFDDDYFDGDSEPTGYAYPDLLAAAAPTTLYAFLEYGGWLTGQTIFDANGNVVESYDDNGDVTVTEYDKANRPIKVTDPSLNLSESVYDENSNVTHVTHTDVDQAGGADEVVEAFFAYDGLNRKTRAKADPGGGDIIDYYGYDSRSNPTVHIDARGNVSRPFFDAASRNVASVLDLTVDGTGATSLDLPQGGGDGRILTRSVYDDDSRLVAQIDDNNNRTSYTYDALNRKTQADFGQFASTGPYSVDITSGEQTLYGVGASGTLIDNQADEQNPSTHKTWVYDKDSNVTSHTDQNGTLHGFTYDGGHRRTRVTITPASPNTHNIEGTTQQDFHYDGLGRQTYALDNNGAGADVTNRWQYDLLSRTLQESTEINGFPERVQSWQYDGSQADAGSGAPTAQFYADGRRLKYAYDDSDRIKSLTDDVTGASPIVEYKYIGPGTRIKAVERANGVDLALAYDDIRRRTDLTEFSTSSVQLELVYRYDAEHQPKFEANLLHGNASEIYNFDSAGRVTTFGRGTINTGTGVLTAPTNLSGVTQVRAFKLDGVHNWEQTVTLTDNLTAVEDREHTNFNEIHKAEDTTGVAADLTYDDQGNLLRRDYPAGSGQRSVTYHWDGLNRLREVKLAAAPQTTLVSYLHATGNQRVARTVNDGGVPSDSSLNGTTHFYYAGWQLCDEYKIFFGNESPWYQYVWGPRHADELVVRDERRGGSTLAQLNDGVAGAGINNSYAGRQYQHHDRGWNVRAVTDEAGTVLERYVYDPHGKPFAFAPNGVTLRPSTTIDQSYGYTNQRYDRETGLWYFKHRYLDDGLGRFVSRDPAGYVDGMNLYTAYFVLTGTDPLGLKVDEDDAGEEARDKRQWSKKRKYKNGKYTEVRDWMTDLEKDEKFTVTVEVLDDKQWQSRLDDWNSRSKKDKRLNSDEKPKANRFDRSTDSITVVPHLVGEKDGVPLRPDGAGYFDMESTLVHELKHAYDEMIARREMPAEDTGAKSERVAREISGTTAEQQNRAARSEWGVKQRTQYGTAPFRSVDPRGGGFRQGVVELFPVQLNVDDGSVKKDAVQKWTYD